MAEINVFWTKTAVFQRNYIFSFWNKRNKSTNYSQKLRVRIKERTDQLKVFPELGKKTDSKSVGVIFIEHYSILYIFMDNKIIVVGF